MISFTGALFWGLARLAKSKGARRVMKKYRVLGTLVLGLLAAGCSTTTPQQDADAIQISDPLENMNRFFFDLNQRLDRNAARPAANAYKDTVPQSVRSSLHNVLD